MKHILIDGTTISKQMDGLSQYILNVTNRLPLHDDRQYHIVVRPGECPVAYMEIWQNKGIDILTASIEPIGVRREFQFYRWLKQQKPFDAVIVPSNQFPIALRVPSIYVVHDIIYERFPSQLGKWAKLKRLWLHFNVARGLKQTNQIIAVSQYTKQEILRFHHNTKEQKIQVVYEGWEHLKTTSTPPSINVPFSKYIVYIGSSRGHKNIQGLLDAMELAAPKLSTTEGLVIVGDSKMLNAHQLDQIKRLKEHVLVTGWINQEELSAYYCQAKAVIFPSLCEGFGIPILEAFYFHKPLLLSNAASLPEVAGEAAIYFDPIKPQEIAEKILYAIQMSDQEQRLWMEQGEERLKLFSWQKTADEIDKIITKQLNA